jgi:uncharacterized LabA/DUF88 family protein
MCSLIVYVDGFNLYHGMRAKYGRRLLWLDLVELATSLRPRSTLLEVQYFTAPVLDDPPAASRQSGYQSALLARHPKRLKIIQGRYQKKRMSCRACGAAWTMYEEKETDVNIATAIVSDTAAGRADSALIFSADSDLVPAVKAASRLDPDQFLAAAFPPDRYSAELKKLMPASFHIGRAKLIAAQLPAAFKDRAGREHTRPTKWR